MRPQVPLIIALAGCALFPALNARAAWLAGGTLVDSVRVDGVLPPCFLPAADGTGDVLLLAGRGNSLYRACRVDLAGDVLAGWPIALPWGFATPDGAGGFLHFYYSPAPGGSDLYAQHFEGDGGIDPAWPAAGLGVAVEPGLQGPQFPCADASGGAFVAWRDTRTNPEGDLYIEHVFAGGTTDPSAPGGVKIAELDGDLDTPGRCMLTLDGSDGFFIAWQVWGSSPTGPREVRVQRISASLVPQWAVGGVAFSSAVGSNTRPRIVADGQGGVYVAWQGSSHVWVQHLDGSGAPMAGWPADGLILSQQESSPSLAADGSGGVIVGWRAADGSFRALRLAPDGSPATGWDAVGVALSAIAGPDQLEICSDGAGGALACFADSDDPDPASPHILRAQHVTAQGAIAAGWPADGEYIRVSSVPFGALRLAPVGPSQAVVMWFERYAVQYPYHDDKVFAQLVPPTVPVAVPGGRGSSALRLEPPMPNPSAGPLRVRFSLPTSDGASIELVDIAGRRVRTLEVGTLGAGPHEVDVAAGAPLTPGVYFLRLEQAGSSRVVRACVLR